MKRTASFLIATLSLSLAAPAFAADPVPGVNVNLGQVPGRIAASAATDATGTVTFFNVPAGRYHISIDASKLTKPVIAVITSGRDKPITTDPVPVDRTSHSGAETVYKLQRLRAMITIVVPANTGTPAGATVKAVSGPAPRDAPPLSTITVVLTAQ